MKIEMKLNSTEMSALCDMIITIGGALGANQSKLIGRVREMREKWQKGSVEASTGSRTSLSCKEIDQDLREYTYTTEVKPCAFIDSVDILKKMSAPFTALAKGIQGIISAYQSFISTADLIGDQIRRISQEYTSLWPSARYAAKTVIDRDGNIATIVILKDDGWDITVKSCKHLGADALGESWWLRQQDVETLRREEQWVTLEKAEKLASNMEATLRDAELLSVISKTNIDGPIPVNELADIAGVIAYWRRDGDTGIKGVATVYWTNDHTLEVVSASKLSCIDPDGVEHECTEADVISNSVLDRALSERFENTLQINPEGPIIAISRDVVVITTTSYSIATGVIELTEWLDINED